MVCHECGDPPRDRRIARDDVPAAVLDDDRVREAPGQEQGIAHRHDAVATAHDVQRRNAQLALDQVGVLRLRAGESADHDGQVKGERCRFRLADGRQHPCQRGALAEAKYPVEVLRAEQFDRPLAGALPSAEPLVPPAEVT